MTSPGSPGPSRFYCPELDGLRFLAFLMVFLHHSLPNTALPAVATPLGSTFAEVLAAAIRSGGFGVDLFFVLSSYLITELLLRESERHGTINVPAFYVRRLLRIWPLYFTFLVIVGLVLPRFTPTPTVSPGVFAAFALFLGNWACVAWGYPASPIAPLWSVSIEEQFYLLWPLIIAAMGARRLGAVAIAMVATSVGARLVYVALGAEHPAIWCSTFTRLDPIAVGVLVCLALRQTARGKPLFDIVREQSHVSRAALIAVGGTLLTGVSYGFNLAETPTIGMALVAYPLIAIASVLLLLGSLGIKWLGGSTLAYLGQISYGLYVFHALALRVVSFGVRHLGLPNPVSVPLAFLLTCALAAASYRILERPFVRYKERFTLVASRPA